MPEYPGLAKGVEPKLMLFGLIVAAAGAAAACIGLFTAYGLRIGRIPIPLSIVGPVLAIGGIALAAVSTRQLKCVRCRQSLDTALAFFPPNAERTVLQSAAACDAQGLAAIPMGSAGEPHVQVSLQYCGTCKQIALLEVDAFRPQRVPLLSKRPLSGPAVGPLSDLLKSRNEAHEERYENAT